MYAINPIELFIIGKTNISVWQSQGERLDTMKYG